MRYLYRECPSREGMKRERVGVYFKRRFLFFSDRVQNSNTACSIACSSSSLSSSSHGLPHDNGFHSESVKRTHIVFWLLLSPVDKPRCRGMDIVSRTARA